MQAVVRAVRYGIRSLSRSPGLSLVAILALALGIGLTTTMFSIVYGALMKGLPYPDGHRIVAIYRNQMSRGGRMGLSVADLADYQTRQRTLDALAAYYSGSVTVSGTGDAERYSGSWVTASTFELTGVRPFLGRVFRPGETAPGGGATVVVAYGLWRRRFGGDSSVIGRTLRANGAPFTIIGVMPPGYAFPDNAELWFPLQLDPLALRRGAGPSLVVVGRLKPGRSLAAANADFGAIARRLQQEHAETNLGVSVTVAHFVDAMIGPQPRRMLYTSLGAVCFVLLIACANVANLLLERAAHRTREVGIRTALGASRAAVVGQFLTEASLLALCGSLLGTGFAAAGISAFNRAIVDTQPPFFIDIRLHPAVVLFIVALLVLATFLSGVMPALQASRADINEVLKDESRGASGLRVGRLSRGLVIGEIALSCGLLVAAGLTIKSVTRLATMDPGMRTAGILTAQLDFPATVTDTAAERRFFEELPGRLEALPGVRSAAIASQLPGVGAKLGEFVVSGAAYPTDRDVPSATWYAVSEGFFRTFAIPILRGRGVTRDDLATSPPVAVVNEAFAQRFFPRADPVGQRIRQGGRASAAPWLTIVGIVASSFSGNPEQPREPAYFVPLAQHGANLASVALATDRAPAELTSLLRRAVASLNPDVPLFRVSTMAEALAQQTWYVRVFGTMFAIFGAIALCLATIGLYAVMAFSVSRRSREVGIRMALGARPGDVVLLVLRQGAWQLVIGLGLGLALAAALARLTRAMLFEVQPGDPAVFAAVVAVLVVVSALACAVPARRASRVDPLRALHSA